MADAGGQPLEWTVSEPEPVLGSSLRITLPAGCKRVVIAYATGEGAEALQWLEPAMTAVHKRRSRVRS